MQVLAKKKSSQIHHTIVSWLNAVRSARGHNVAVVYTSVCVQHLLAAPSTLGQTAEESMVRTTLHTQPIYRLQ